MTTSWPMRGITMPPQPRPAQFCATRTQHELLGLAAPSPGPQYWRGMRDEPLRLVPWFLAWRSQKNWTLMRPYLSVNTSSPDGPTTTAVCGPTMHGRGVARAGRYDSAAGTASKLLW